VECSGTPYAVTDVDAMVEDAVHYDAGKDVSSDACDSCEKSYVDVFGVNLFHFNILHDVK
jgi:hypothetical protein